MNYGGCPVRHRGPALIAFVLSVLPCRLAAETVTVFAAASLATALDDIGAAWKAQTGHVMVASYAGTPALARQIQAGAPADVFIASSPDWMDMLEASGDLRRGTRRDILGNRLVLIAHGADAPPVQMDGTLDLPGMLGDERLAMALVDAVPAGIAGKAALTHLGLWDSVAPLVAQADNVRAALSFVARNEAPLGVVYASDAAVEQSVTIIGTFPSDSHEPIIYPAAITAQSSSPAAQAFLDFLTSDTARDIWSGFDFLTLN